MANSCTKDSDVTGPKLYPTLDIDFAECSSLPLSIQAGSKVAKLPHMVAGVCKSVNPTTGAEAWPTGLQTRKVLVQADGIGSSHDGSEVCGTHRRN